MRRIVLIALLVTSVTATSAADPLHPTVIELFQSQGCSSCPPANAILNRLADRSDLLPLSFAVTYWDQLGWKDTFARPAFTQRQWDYARRAGRREVATPQMIFNGRANVVGSDPAQVATALRGSDRGDAGPTIGVRDGHVDISGPNAGSASIVWLVRYDPRTIAVPIRAGENGGRTLPHRDVVRALVRLGDWRGGAARFPIPTSPDPALRGAVLVQQGTGGPIIAAARF